MRGWSHEGGVGRRGRGVGEAWAVPASRCSGGSRSRARKPTTKPARLPAAVVGQESSGAEVEVAGGACGGGRGPCRRPSRSRSKPSPRPRRSTAERGGRAGCERRCERRCRVGRALAARAVCARRVPYRHRRRVLLLVQQLLRREIVHRAHLQSAGGVYGVSYTRGELWRRACYASRVRTPRTPSGRRRRRAWCGPPTRRGSARATRA